MKSKSQTIIDTESTYSEDCLEYVNKEYETDVIRSLGIKTDWGKNYDQASYDFFED